MSDECNHEWLVPHQNRTTCKRCGRDGWICMDVEAESALHWAKLRLAEAEKERDEYRELFALEHNKLIVTTDALEAIAANANYSWIEPIEILSVRIQIAKQALDEIKENK